jgi:hypothetical protein
MEEVEMVHRPPLGPPGAPPRSSSRSRGDDPLSTVLSYDEEESSSTVSADSWREHQAEILDVLRTSRKPLTVDALSRKVGLGFLPLSELLLDLARHNEVTLRGSPGKEMVALSHASIR